MRHPLRVVVVLSLFVTAVVLAQAKPPGMDESQAVNLKDAKWVAAKPPIPAGVMAPVTVSAMVAPESIIRPKRSQASASRPPLNAPALR